MAQFVEARTGRAVPLRRPLVTKEQALRWASYAGASLAACAALPVKILQRTFVD